MKLICLSVSMLALGSFAAHADTSAEFFRDAPEAMEIHASDLLGMKVYRGDAVETDNPGQPGPVSDWDEVGKVDDLILARDGRVAAVLVEVGGFLGIGSHQVAVNMGAIRFVPNGTTTDNASDYFLVMDTPRNALEAAPAYDRSATSSGQAAMIGTDSHPTEARTTIAAANGTDDGLPTHRADMASTGAGTAHEGGTAAAAPGNHAPVMRDGFVLLPPETMTSGMLTGATVYDVDDNSIGSVSDLLIGSDDRLEAVIVNMGGFLGIGSKPVALMIPDLDILRSANGDEVRIYVSLSRDELEALPDHPQ